MFAVIRNPSMVVPGLFAGTVVSRHRLLRCANAKRAKLNAACRKANGANTWVDLEVGAIDTDNGTTARVRTGDRE